MNKFKTRLRNTIVPITQNLNLPLYQIKNQRDWIAHIDDECNLGNGYIVTLKEPFCFVHDPTCAVRGFDTISELKSGTTKSSVY